MRIQLDQLKVIPNQIPDDSIDTTAMRGRKGRKPLSKVKKITSSYFRGAMLHSPADRGHVQFQCIDDCSSSTMLGDIDGVKFPGTVAKKPFSDV